MRITAAPRSRAALTSAAHRATPAARSGASGAAERPGRSKMSSARVRLSRSCQRKTRRLQVDRGWYSSSEDQSPEEAAASR